MSETPAPTAPKRGSKTRGKLLLLAAGLVALIAIIIVIKRPSRPPPPVKARTLGALLELSAGPVTVGDPASPSGASPTEALSGAPLPTGARVSTGKGGRALIRTGDGGRLVLRSETEVVLEERGFSLERGEVWLDAPKADGAPIEAKVGQHRASASDAGLSLRRDPDTTEVYVARGLAILTSPGGRVEVSAGESGTARGGDAPKVSPVAFWNDWTGGMGDTRATRASIGSGTGQLYGLDPNRAAGAKPKPLGIAKQVVRAVVRDGVAETEVDQTFSNPSGAAVEGYYWFTVPSEASVVGFALETNGVLVDGEIVERREAQAAYGTAVKQGFDPALLEWVDGRTYRARIFPIPASGTRRVVLRYLELVRTVEGKSRYVYPLRSDDPVRFDEFSLSVDLGEGAAQKFDVATSLDALMDKDSRHVTMRRSGYLPRADFQVEFSHKTKRSPVQAFRFSSGKDQADYIMVRYIPNVDFGAVERSRGAVVLAVDTSSGGDETARQLRSTAAEAVLRALSEEDEFALVAVDLSPRVLYPEKGLSKATPKDIAKALERLSEHSVAGATDVGAMFEPSLERLHGAEAPAMVYIGDGISTSGESGPEALLERLRRSLAGSRARFFAAGVGADARHPLLESLTRAGGGVYLRIDEPEQVTGVALRLTSAIKTPTLTDVELDMGAGLDQPFYSATGKLARGDELLLLARTHHALPSHVVIKGRVGKKELSEKYELKLETSVTTGLVPRLWAAEYTRRLLGTASGGDEARSKVLSLGLEYGLLTPYTSFLALDSEASYSRQGIKRKHSPLRGIKLTAIESDASEQALALQYTGHVLAVAGCAKDGAPVGNRSTKESTEPSSPDGVSQGGTGMRAKGEEGATGSPTVAKAPHPVAYASAASPSPTSATPGGLGMQAGGAAGERPGDEASPAKPRLATGAPRREDQAGTKAGPLPAAAPPPPPAGLGRGPGAPREADTDRDKQKKDARVEAARPPAPPVVPRKPVAQCSDASSRPLYERLILWQKRLASVRQAADLPAQYEMARSACELPDWRDQSALLDLIQQKVDTERAAELLLSHLASEPEAQRYVARALLRRTTDAGITATVSRVLFGGRVDWNQVDREVLDAKTPEDKLARLRAAILLAPGHPAGDLRLMRLLAGQGQRAEAILHGRRLRDRGMQSPAVAQALGDLLAEAGEKDEALRSYSEVVEFDPASPTSRRLLGDIFLRQGWHDAAYRQYKTLVDLAPKAPSSWLRLAMAAAGTGRTDEAFRLEREVASGEGTPGPNDPRYWARLWSAARLGLLLSEPAKLTTPDAQEGITRKLKQLQLFSGPATLVLLTYRDLEARLAIAAVDERKQGPAMETTDAGEVGLFALFQPTDAWAKGGWAVRWRGDAAGRAVKFQLVVLGWDGKKFSVSVRNEELRADSKQLAL